MRALLEIAAVGLVTLVVGCGFTSPDAPSSGDLSAPAQGQGVQVDLAGSVGAGQELTLCKYFTLGAPLGIAAFEHVRTLPHCVRIELAEPLPEGADGQLVKGSAFDCAAADAENDAPLYSSEASSDARPVNHGIAIAANQVLLLRYHALNSTREPAEARATVNLWSAAP